MFFLKKSASLSLSGAVSKLLEKDEKKRKMPLSIAFCAIRDSFSSAQDSVMLEMKAISATFFPLLKTNRFMSFGMVSFKAFEIGSMSAMFCPFFLT